MTDARTLADAIAERLEISSQNPEGFTAVPNRTATLMLAVLSQADTLCEWVFRYAGTGHFQCRACLASGSGCDFDHRDGCWIPDLVAALDALAAHWGIGGGDDE